MPSSDAKLQRAARRLDHVLTALAAVLAVITLHIVAEEWGRGVSPLIASAAACTSVLPALCYGWALLALRRSFNEVARGEFIGSALHQGLVRVGWSLIAAGLSSVVATPILTILARRLAQAGTMPPFAIRIDAAYIMLAIVGAAILILARLFAMAADYRVRGDALQLELDEFL